MKLLIAVLILIFTVVLVSITVVYGQEKVTIAQVAKLIVKVHVINDDGGMMKDKDFTIMIEGNNPSETQFSGSESGKIIQLGPGSYNINPEPWSHLSTYEASPPCPGNIKSGQTRTCTITFNDITSSPRPATAGILIIKKHVINDDGGSKKANQFTIDISGNNPSDRQFFASETGTSVILGAGLYGVSELSDSSYASHFSSECNGIMAATETKTCTITNNDIAR